MTGPMDKEKDNPDLYRQEKTRFTEDQMIEAITKANGQIMLAAKMLHCDRSAIYHRASTNPRVKEAIMLAREELVDLAESKLRLAILDGQSWAIQLALRTIGKERGYVERIESTGKDGDAIVVTLSLPHNERDVIENEPPEQIADGE